MLNRSSSSRWWSRLAHAGVGLATLVLLTTTARAQQRWFELYDDGLRAYQQGQWSIAEDKLKSALAKNPRQGRRQLFYGTRREDYLPQYYLALVYLKEGRAKDAADLFAKVERDGLITSRDREYAELSQSVQAARQLMASATPTESRPTRGAAPPAPAAVGPRPVDSTVDQQQVAESRRESATRTSNQVTALIASRQYQQARSVLASGRAALDPERLDRLTKSIDLGESEQNLQAAVSRADWADAQRQLSRIAAVDPTYARLPEYRKTVEDGQAAVTAAAIERNALRAFFRGDYSRTLSLLDAPGIKQYPTPRRLFYMACSNAALGLLEGTNGQSRIARARAQFAEAKRGQQEFAIDRRYVSPRILDVLQNGRP